MEIAAWFVKHQREITVKEMRPIVSKYFPTDESFIEFLEYLKTPKGTNEFRRELRDAMRRGHISLPPEEEYLVSVHKAATAQYTTEDSGAKTGGNSPQTWKYYVRIRDPGASYFTKGSIIPWDEYKEEDRKIRERGEKPPSVEIVREPAPGNGNGDKELPATVQGEPIPEKYRTLIPLINEPLPPGTDYLVPAVVPEEGERKIDVVLRQLKEGVESIQGSEQFCLFLITMAKFHEYSLGNQILIALQKPEATRVAGFQTWKNLGRWVKKGATGIAILAPVMPPKPKKEEREGEEEEVPLSPVYFKVVHVFDISQTEGKPLPEFDVPVLTGEANEELFAKALALAKVQGLEVDFGMMPAWEPSVKGFYSGKNIWVKPDEPRAQQLKTLLHEMAHYYSEGVFRIPRQDAETIAESAAFAVGAHFGFDSGTRSFPYVALWSRDDKVLKANLASIRKVVSTILEGLEKSPNSEEKLVPALKPFEPYHFAEYVLRYNRFSDAEIPIYSGLTGGNPLRVPDHIWREVIEETEGEFTKQGELNVFHIPEKGRPDYMRAAPTWRDVASTISLGAGEENGIISSPLAMGDKLKKLVPGWEVSVFEIPVPKFQLSIGSIDDIKKTVEILLWEGASYKDALAILAHEYAHTDGEKFIKGQSEMETWRKGEVFARRWDALPEYIRLGEELASHYESHKSYPRIVDGIRKWLSSISSVIPTKPTTPSPSGEMEFICDSPEWIPFTVEDIGYRDKLDNAFEMAFAKVQGK